MVGPQWFADWRMDQNLVAGGTRFRMSYNFNVCMRQFVTDSPISIEGSDRVGVSGEVRFFQNSRQQLNRGFDIGNRGRFIDRVDIACRY